VHHLFELWHSSVGGNDEPGESLVDGEKPVDVRVEAPFRIQWMAKIVRGRHFARHETNVLEKCSREPS
jgi:hypothetical protein